MLVSFSVTTVLRGAGMYHRELSILVMLSACTQTPDTSTTNAPILTESFDSPDFVTLHRVGAIKAASHKVAAERISPTQFAVSPATDDLMSTEESRVLLSLLVGCALPPTESLIGKVTFEGVNFDLEFFGEIGLAPHWLHRPLDREERGWISACVFSHLNIHAEEIPISMRGTKRQLSAPLEERQSFPVQEGAFWGDMFAEQLAWFACRGEGLLTLPLPSGLVDRDCAKQDPSNPALTLCGLSFAGNCSSLCGARREVITVYVTP